MPDPLRVLLADHWGALALLAALAGVAILAALGLLPGRGRRGRRRETAALVAHLQGTREAEQAALARRLHGELGGLLVGAKMDLVWLRRRLDNGDAPLAERWNRLQGSLEQALDLGRGIIEDLRPTLIDNLGLVAALRWLASETARRSGLACRECWCTEEELGDLGPEARIALYRIAQECLDNVVKHAQATAFEVALACTAHGVTLAVTDDGRGIAGRGIEGRGSEARDIGLPRSFGIAGLRHRASALGGELAIGPGPGGRGTLARVTIPRTQARRDAAAPPPASDPGS